MLSVLDKLERSRARSGYKYIAYDPRRRSAYCVCYKKQRSRAVSTLHEAAVDLLRMQDISTSHAPRSSVPPALAAPALAAPALAASGGVSAAQWMSKPRVNFSSDCELFGARIRLIRRDRRDGALAVIKEWHPCAEAGFGVVFDDKPDRVFYEDLLRKGRRDWVVIPWEANVWNTANLRPACCKCFHPLGEGASAWTRCVGCGSMEPGASSASMGKRTRTTDPYRANPVNYTDPSE